MKTDELLLIDLSSLSHPIWHVSQNEPDPNHVSTAIVARVRALSTEHPHAAVCCDSGKSFRYDISADYKANRPERLGTLMHQIKLAEETLARDGFPVWKVAGFEADDIIATATAKALAIEDTSVLIASADKDLLQLVNGRVSAKSLTNGSVLDSDAVVAKFGVKPEQMLDYLCLVGDASDNIAGAKGIGGVRASALLKKYGTLEHVYKAIDKGMTPDITPAQRTALQEFRPRWQTVRSLIALRTDVDINFEEIAAERTPVVEEMRPDDHPPIYADEEGDWKAANAGAQSQQMGEPEPVSTNGVPQMPEAPAPPKMPTAAEMWQNTQKPIDVGEKPPVVLPAPVDFTMQLEPRNLDEAARLSTHMFKARLFSAYGTWEGIFSTILAGRELGMPAMASLRNMHIIEGKPTLSAGAIQALVLKSGKAKFFRCTERTNERATFETQRGDDPPISLTFTIEDGRRAFAGDDKAWAKSGWGRNPADLCVARASSKLARLVFPDIVAGLYSPEEFD